MSTFFKYVVLKLQGASVIRTVYYFTEKKPPFSSQSIFFLVKDKLIQKY